MEIFSHHIQMHVMGMYVVGDFFLAEARRKHSLFPLRDMKHKTRLNNPPANPTCSQTVWFRVGEINNEVYYRMALSPVPSRKSRQRAVSLVGTRQKLCIGSRWKITVSPCGSFDVFGEIFTARDVTCVRVRARERRSFFVFTQQRCAVLNSPLFLYCCEGER